jgi:hypothetical protein
VTGTSQQSPKVLHVCSQMLLGAPSLGERGEEPPEGSGQLVEILPWGEVSEAAVSVYNFGPRSCRAPQTESTTTSWPSTAY